VGQTQKSYTKPSHAHHFGTLTYCGVLDCTATYAKVSPLVAEGRVTNEAAYLRRRRFWTLVKQAGKTFEPVAIELLLSKHPREHIPMAYA
jgi:hypothetical protein